MKRVLLLILLTVPFWSFSPTEEPLPPEGDDSVTIYFAEQGSRTQFSAGLRSLRQIAGAPEAFYTYYWEFGDGTFSFDEMPVHDYSSRSEEHTSELQSLMRISYAVFCLKKQKLIQIAR